MSFRQYGGINYAARNNIVKNNYSNANNLSVMTKVGQSSSIINFESDISGNTMYGPYNFIGDVNVTGNLSVIGTGNGIIFPDTSVQYTSVTSTDTYWLEYSNTKIYYTGTVLAGINPDTTFPALDPDVKFATNGNVSINGKLNVGNITSGSAISLFSVDGLTGNTIVGGTLTVTGNATLSGTNTITGYAPLASPEFTGTPNAPTALAGTNTIQIATTAFVQSAVAGGGGGSSQIYGNGADGNLTFNGNAVTGFSISGSVYTMTREIYANDINMTGGYTIKPSGFRLFCSGTFTSSGSTNTISCAGGNGGSGSSDRDGGAAGAGGAGGAGGAIGGAGGGGSSDNYSLPEAGFSTSNSFSADLGSGGAGSKVYDTAGGAGGTTSKLSTTPQFFWKSYLNIYTMTDINGTHYAGGAGGGGGSGYGGMNGGAGGGGGGGGGSMAIFLCKLNLTTLLNITANGGDGGGGANDGDNSGGGGGGGGGFVLFCTSSSSSTSNLTVTANGGTRGITNNILGQASNGVNGIVSEFYNLS